MSKWPYFEVLTIRKNIYHFSHKVVHCSPIIKMIIDTLCKRCDVLHTTHSLYILIEIKLFQTSVMPPFIKEDDDPYPKGEPKWPQISPKALYHYFVIRILQQQCLEWFSNKNPRIFPKNCCFFLTIFWLLNCVGELENT